MNKDINFYIPNCEEFCRGYEAYNQRERKGPVYFVAMDMISENWGDSVGMGIKVGNLLVLFNIFKINIPLKIDTAFTLRHPAMSPINLF